MNNFYREPIDLSPFIGASQTPDGKKRKLIKLYEAEAQKQLDNGDLIAYNSTLEKIKELDKE